MNETQERRVLDHVRRLLDEGAGVIIRRPPREITEPGDECRRYEPGSDVVMIFVAE